MKKLIRWLANISGVTSDIQAETCKKVGYQMQSYSHWFTGGLLVKGSKIDMSNLLYEYPEWCLLHGAPHLFGTQWVDLREKLWKLSDENRCIIFEQDKTE